MSFDASDRFPLPDPNRFGDDLVDNIQSIRDMCNPHLIEPLLPNEEKELLRIRHRTRSMQRSLLIALEAGKIEPENYMSKLIDLTRAAMDRNREVLGDHRFLAIFGEAGFAPEGLVDKHVFLSQFS